MIPQRTDFENRQPWRRPTAQTVEADIRTVPEPDVALGLAAGLTLLARLGRRRSIQR